MKKDLGALSLLQKYAFVGIRISRRGGGLFGTKCIVVLPKTN
eukprot:CAMPEP_0203758730 /NCGR_PEP_ID=MMETSP0098-20131031/11551_1 /ASSEMBLY_ACC=CAM_ASM_000208 /TAXON_ID=96639 /ORGANISM=" , Strain NY0313808BC1" /LENGTH=41 /DNA_ID= /DNA_START= /DNA_END= /DNA_ORIENTATION=